MITLKDLSLQRGAKKLLDEVSLTIFAGQKIGIIGVNGSGKSSLFGMLLGNLQPDAGDLQIPSTLRVAHLSQEIPHGKMSAIQYVIQGDKELAYLLHEIDVAEKRNDDFALAALHSKLYEIDGYSAEANAGKLLDGLGFSSDEHQKPVDEFSGGWRMRLNLAQVLMARSDLLLLDEPTNHLDMDAIIWLEKFLKYYDGTLLLISHDREFLDNVIDRVVYIANKKLELYLGNYSSFELQRAEKLALEQAMFTKQQTKIKHMESFVNRFRAKASKARQAQSRLKLLEKMQKVSLTHIDSPFSFGFFESKPCGAPVINFEKVDFSYDKKEVLHHINFSLTPGDRVGLLGHNGAGKSTFLKVLAGMLQPKSGIIEVSKALKIGYFAQHQVDQLTMSESAVYHLMDSDRQVSEQQARNYLGGFGFRGDMVFEPVKHFSGGEKARLVLALLVWQKPNLLLLDEPTNHLDIDMRRALTYALQEFDGTLVLVSHDRYLLKAAVNEFYLVHDRHVEKFDGDLNDYQKWLNENKAEPQQYKNEIKVDKAQEKTVDFKKTQQLEKKLQKLYDEKEKLEHELSDVGLYQEKEKKLLAVKMEKLAKVKHCIQECEEKWFGMQE